jgi:hypothetical protein
MAEQPNALMLPSPKDWLSALRDTLRRFSNDFGDALHGRAPEPIDPNDPRLVTALLIGVVIFLAGLTLAVGLQRAWLMLGQP